MPVRLRAHPNADTLSIVDIDGYQTVVKTADWANTQVAAFIPPDSVVPVDRDEYAFLGGKSRVTVRRFRGEWSHGLLMPAPIYAKVGDDVAAELGITHYEPTMRSEQAGTGGDAERGPVGFHPIYDVEHYRRYTDVLRLGELVVVSEKIHGTNARFTFSDGRMYCGSRREWKTERAGSVYWQALSKYPQIESLLRDNPGLTLYGEIYGDVQDLRYGHGKGEISFAAFDLYRGNKAVGRVRQFIDGLAERLGYYRVETPVGYLPFTEAVNLCTVYAVPWVPIISNYEGSEVVEFVPAMINAAEGQTMLGGDHMREGIVIRPLHERTDRGIGRVQLKVINNAYLERSGK